MANSEVVNSLLLFQCCFTFNSDFFSLLCLILKTDMLGPSMSLYYLTIQLFAYAHVFAKRFVYVDYVSTKNSACT